MSEADSKKDDLCCDTPKDTRRDVQSAAVNVEMHLMVLLCLLRMMARRFAAARWQT